MSMSLQDLSTGTAVHPGSPRSAIGQYLPVAAALVVALGSTVTLAALDKPLDRHALVPSVIECAEANAETSSSAGPQTQMVQRLDEAGARAMLLRFELRPGGSGTGVGSPAKAGSSLL